MGLDWRRFLVVEDERGKVIACGQIKPHAGGVRELASIVVSPAWQGKGLARMVIERLMAQAGPPLYLTCRDSLENLYRRFGFQVVSDPGEMPPYFRRVWWVFALFRRFSPQVPRLLVMRWEK